MEIRLVRHRRVTFTGAISGTFKTTSKYIKENLIRGRIIKGYSFCKDKIYDGLGSDMYFSILNIPESIVVKLESQNQLKNNEKEINMSVSLIVMQDGKCINKSLAGHYWKRNIELENKLIKILEEKLCIIIDRKKVLETRKGNN